MTIQSRYQLQLILDSTRGGLLRALAEAERRNCPVLEISSHPTRGGRTISVNFVVEQDRRRAERLARQLDRLVEVRSVALRSVCAPVLQDGALL